MQRVHDRVRSALHEAATLVRRLVAADPVVGGLERSQDGEDHGEVPAGALADRRDRRGEHHAAVQDVTDDDEQQHDDHREEQPVEHEAEERQLEHVETDVGPELGVGHIERLTVPEQQPRLPLCRRRQREEEREHRGHCVAVHAESPSERLVEALDDGVGVGWKTGRCELVGDRQVGPGQDREQREEQREQQQPGPERAPEHAGLPESVVPQHVDVEAGERPAEDDHHEDEDTDGDDGHAPRGTHPGAPPGKVGGSAHGREAIS